MLTVEAEEQVMPKVTVAERLTAEAARRQLGGVINAGNFTTTLLTENALPLTAAAGLGTMPLLGLNTKLDDQMVCGGADMCVYNQGPGQNAFGTRPRAAAGTPAAATRFRMPFALWSATA